jgi:TonB family protein
MNRLQKKCFIVATGMHLLLLLILLVGPAFLSSSSKLDDSQVLTLIDLSKLSDKPTSGGGPSIPPPPSAQQQVQTPVAPPATKPTPQARDIQPTPPKDTPKLIQPTRETVIAVKPTKPVKPQISTTLVARNKTDSKTDSKADSRTQDITAAKRQADQINKSLRNLRDDLSSTTTIELPSGLGDGEANVNYAQAVQSIFESRWVQLDNAVADETAAKASVTIASDGTLITARITQSSGNSQVDALVQRTLDSVKLPPFPPGAKETQRTYIINFNHTVKRLLG